MAKIELTNQQLQLIKNALELYSRIGILQIDKIIDHPTVEKLIIDQFSKHTPLQVGDKTGRGEVVEVGEGWIKTKGTWGNGEEIRTWTDTENIKHFPDWNKVHETQDKIRQLCSEMKNLISGDPLIASQNASYGIHNPRVGEENRQAYDIIQVIRHEFWKADPDHNPYVVSSSVHRSSGEPLPKVEVDEEEWQEYLKKFKG